MNITQKRDYVWNTVGVLLQNLISPVLLIVVAYVNGVIDVGLFSFAFSVAIVFWMIGMWGGRTYQVSDLSSEFSTKSYIWVRMILAAVVAVAAFLFCLLNNYDVMKSSLIGVLVLFKIIESVSDVFYGILQRHDNLYIAGRSLIIKALLGIVTFILVDIATGSIVYASMGIVIINFLVFFLYDLAYVRKLENVKIVLKDASVYIREALLVLRATLPVFIVSFLAIFSLNIPRFYIDRFNESENAYFGIMAMPITLVLLVMTFIMQPNMVRLARFYKDNKADNFKKTLNNISLITLGVGVIVLAATYLFGEMVLTLVFSIDFLPYRLELMIIVTGAVLNAFVAVGINALTIMRRFKGLFYSLLSTSVLLAPLSYTLVKTLGVLGGVIAFSGISLIQATMLLIVYRYELRNGKKHV